jgi:hypothetical protein
MTLRERNLAFHHALELPAIREACQVVGARLARELARAIQRDRDLVRNGASRSGGGSHRE